MSEITLYHNPRCSKSRQTLELLQQRGIKPSIVEYLKTPPNADQLGKILDLLALEPRDLMRTNESEYKKQGLDNPQLSRDELIQAMIDHPILIQRPIVLANGRAGIGRPPENVLELLKK